MRLLSWLASPWAFAIGFCALVLAAEQQVGSFAERVGLTRPFWYEEVEARARRGRIDVIFLGSSRTSAAIDVSTSEAAISRRVGRDAGVANMGHGYSTWPQHYLGVRNVWQTAPANLQGCLLVVEAPGGRPPVATWERWSKPGGLAFLLRVLRPGDLKRLWFSGPRLEEKLETTVYSLVPSALLRYGPVVRTAVLDRGERWLSAATGSPTAGPRADTGARAELSLGGGIRTGNEDVRRLREAMQRDSPQPATRRGPDVAWKDTVLRDLVLLAESFHGQVILLDVPLSSRERTAAIDDYLGLADQKGAAAFDSAAADWGVARLSTAMAFADEDFPDLVHMGKGARHEFTQNVAERLAERVLSTRRE